MAENNSSSVISVRKLNKSFGRDKVLKNVNLEIHKGEIFGFLGPNGAGKTTTIRIILDVLRSNKGEINLFGVSNRKIKKAHQKIGYLSDDMIMDEDLTGKQYLNFVNHTYGGKYGARINELSKVLDVRLNKKIGKYSRGTQQKIGLIAALMHEPELLILDEPSSGFDPLMQQKFISLILEYRDNGGTVFISSHVLNEVQEICDRVAFIKNGSIIGVKNLAGITHKATKKITIFAQESSKKRIKRFYKSVEGLQLLNDVNSYLVFSYVGDIKKVLRYFSLQDIEDMMIEEPNLEEVFLDFYQAHSKKKELV